MVLGCGAAVLCLAALIMGICAFWDQVCFGHLDNNVSANLMVTPALIATGWWFSLSCGVIRTIPHKAFGIAIMAVLIVYLFGAVRGFSASCGSVGTSPRSDSFK